MFFSKSARILAIIAFAFGLLQLVLGLSIATDLIGPYEDALRRFTTKSSSGQVIDAGGYAILIAAALGTLSEIGITLHKIREEE